MKAAFLFALLCCFQAEAQISKPPRIWYERDPYYQSEGFNLGHILNFERSGLVIRTYEGNMNLGFGTSAGEFSDPTCMEDPKADKNDCSMFTNPWSFSSVHRSMYWRYLRFSKNLQAPVLIYYVTPYISTEHIITKTKNFVKGFYPVDPHLAIAPSYIMSAWQMPVGMTINDAKGSLDGRFVHASLDHTLLKSFEVILQEGGFGNNFRRMSVSDQGLFDYIVQTMQTGKTVRIGYIELTESENDFLRWFKAYDSRYRVISVEIQNDSPSAGVPQ